MDDNDWSTIAARFRENQSWKSIELHSREDMRAEDADMAGKMVYHTTAEHYIETDSGQRYLETLSLEGSKVVLKSIHYADGKRCADVTFNPDQPDQQTSVIIKRSFLMEGKSDKVDRPIPLLYLYVGRDSLAQPSSQPSPVAATEILGRPADQWLFRSVRLFMTQDMVYALDHATGLPLKVEGFSVGDKSPERPPLWTLQADSLDRVGDRTFPLRSHQTDYAPRVVPAASADAPAPPTPPQPLIQRTYLVESVEFDKDYPTSQFWPVVQPGVGVLDSIRNTTYKQPGEAPEAAAPAVGATPITATAPTDWTSSASSLALVAGLLAVAIGLFMRLGRR